MSAIEVEVEEEIKEVSNVSLKSQVLHKLLPVSSTLSSVSTMYAAQDVDKLVILALIAMVDNELNDVASDGEDSDIQAQLARTILFNIAIWGLPMLTIVANSVMRYFTSLKVGVFLESLRAQKSKTAYLIVLGYLIFAGPTTISDTTINVAMSETLKKEWPPFAIIIESILSFIFLLPLNIYGIHTLHERMKLIYDSYITGDDKKLFSRRLEAIFYDLKNLPEAEQAEKLRPLLNIIRGAENMNDAQPVSYHEIMGLSREKLKQLAEEYCQQENLPDGSSWASTVATGITVLFSCSGGAATMRSPYLFYTNTCNILTPPSWMLTSISGLTKTAFYMAGYDSVMWYAKHYNRLFGSAPIRYGIGAALMAISAAGFWEVAQNAVAVVSDSRTWWTILSKIIILFEGIVANMSGAAALAILIMEENRLSKLNAPDLATAFKERASEVLKLSSESSDEESVDSSSTVSESSDEEQLLITRPVNSSSTATGIGSWMCAAVKACVPSTFEGWGGGYQSCSFFSNPDSNRRRSLLPSIIPGLLPRASSL
jgi:hypothetical protein